MLKNSNKLVTIYTVLIPTKTLWKQYTYNNYCRGVTKTLLLSCSLAFIIEIKSRDLVIRLPCKYLSKVWGWRRGVNPGDINKAEVIWWRVIAGIAVGEATIKPGSWESKVHSLAEDYYVSHYWNYNREWIYMTNWGDLEQLEHRMALWMIDWFCGMINLIREFTLYKGYLLSFSVWWKTLPATKEYGFLDGHYEFTKKLIANIFYSSLNFTYDDWMKCNVSSL